MPKFDQSHLLIGFLALSCLFFLHIFFVGAEISNREDSPNFYTFAPDLSFAYACSPTDDNELDYFEFYQPFLEQHGFEVRGSPQDFVAIDHKRRMISFSVTLNGGVEHHVDLNSEPPTIRDPALSKIFWLWSRKL